MGKGAGGSKIARNASTLPPAVSATMKVNAIWNKGPRMKRLRPVPRATRNVATITKVESPIGLPQNESSK
jgi:hypothetical protein